MVPAQKLQSEFSLPAPYLNEVLSTHGPPRTTALQSQFLFPSLPTTLVKQEHRMSVLPVS